MDSFGKRLQEKRKSKGYSQEELAKLLGKSGKSIKQAVSQWELNKTEPSLSDLTLLAQILETSIDYLVDGKLTSEVMEKQGDYVTMKKDELIDLLTDRVQSQRQQIQKLKNIKGALVQE